MNKDDLIFELQRQLSREAPDSSRKNNHDFMGWFENRRSEVEDLLIEFIDDNEVVELFAALRKEQRLG